MLLADEDDKFNHYSVLLTTSRVDEQFPNYVFLFLFNSERISDEDTIISPSLSSYSNRLLERDYYRNLLIRLRPRRKKNNNSSNKTSRNKFEKKIDFLFFVKFIGK